MSSPSTDVVLITCDALRADYVGVPAGPGRGSLTPNLDALAGAGVRFTHAVSQGFRTPISMASLFTGRYPSRLRWFSVSSPFALRRGVTGVLPGEAPMLAEILAGRGYRTAGIHSNPLLSRLFDYHRGFELFDDDLFLAGTWLPDRLKRWAYRLPQLFRVATHLPASAINAKTARWLAGDPRPAFLWLHYMDTHGPYCSRSGVRYWRRLRAQLLYQKAVTQERAVTEPERAELRRTYRKQVRYVDGQLGRLFDDLRRRGRFDDALIVLTADHGEEFGEHGRYSHHSTLYETLLRVPLIVKLPGGRHAGRVIDTPVALLQVLPTILDVAGIRAAADLDGTSLLPLIEGWPGAGLDWIVSEAKTSPDYKAAIRSGPFKLIVDRRRGARRLFNLDEDPDERVDLAAHRPDIADRWENQLELVLAVRTAPGGGGPAARDLDGATAGRLRDLGYL